MKNWPLLWQIWVWFVGLVLGVGVLILVVTPYSLDGFFKNEMEKQLENAQQQFVNQLISLSEGTNTGLPDSRLLEPGRGGPNNVRAVRHYLFMNGTELVPMFMGRGDDGGRGRNNSFMDRREGINRELNQTIMQRIQEAVKQGDVPILRIESNDEFVFASIRRVTLSDRELTVVSLISGVYYKELVNSMYLRILVLVVVAIILSWIPAYLLAKWLSKPLVKIGESVQRIAKHEWHEPILTDRKDEVGQLAMSIEEMRQQLLQAETEQQTMLQHLSHEMKTPVMIIRSYIQSIRDGIFPRGDLQLSLETMDTQTIRLEKRVADLIYLTKLRHWSEQPLKKIRFDWDQLILDVLDSFRHQRTEVNWEVNLQAVSVFGDPMRWQIALENIFENQLRYAQSEIVVELGEEIVTQEDVERSQMKKVILTISNDGIPMPEGLLGDRFEPFQKGLGGQNGLGLAISQRIMVLHGAKLIVTNLHGGGVQFRVEWLMEESE